MVFRERIPFKLFFLCLYLFILLQAPFAETIRAGLVQSNQENENRLEHVPDQYDLFLINQYPKYFDSTVSVVYAPFDKCLSLLDSGKINLMMGVPYQKKYESKYTYIEPPYITVCHLLITQFENQTYFYGDTSNLSGAAVGILRSESYLADELEQFAAAKNFSVHITFYDDSTSLERDFTTKKLQLKFVCASKLLYNEKIVWNFGNYQLSIITRKSDAALAAHLTSFLKQILVRQVFETAYWHAKTSDSLALAAGNLTSEEINFIKHNREIFYYEKVPLEKVWDFFHLTTNLYFTPASSVSPDVVKQGITIESTAMPDNIEHSLKCDCTIPFSNATQWVVLHPDFDQESFFSLIANNKFEKTIKFAVYSNITDTIPFYHDKFGKFTYTEYDSIAKCLNAVSKHVCDATIIPDYLLGSANTLSEYPNLKNAQLLKFTVPYHLHISGDSTGLLRSILNKTIQQMPSDLMENQMSEIAKTMPHTPGDLAVKKQWQQIFSLIAAAFIIFLIFYFQIRSRHFKRWAYTDYLTGLMNRRCFEQTADKVLKKNQKYTYAVIESDIRGFKYINRIYGYAYGDESLKFFSHCLTSYGADVVAVAHGYADRFYIMIKVTDFAECEKRCSDFLEWCRVESGKYNFHFLIKSGIALSGINRGTDTIQNLIDRAAYAKQTIQRDRMKNTSFFTPEMEQKMITDQKIESCIQKAFDNNEFFVVYQPKIDLRTEKITGAEALVRWNSPENGLLHPDSFLPILEREGFILKLDFYVYKKVFEFIQQQIDCGNKTVPVSVNMSRMHLNTPEFIHNFTGLFSQFHISSSCIEVEVIERATGMSDMLLRNVTKQLQQQGFRVAMDDFGSGESSLNMLHTIPVDVLKLDKDFLYEAETSPDSKVIITKIMEMAKELGKETVCEGVETMNQADFLRSIGCNMAQGFYYSKPLSEETFVSYIKDHSC